MSIQEPPSNSNYRLEKAHYIHRRINGVFSDSGPVLLRLIDTISKEFELNLEKVDDPFDLELAFFELISRADQLTQLLDELKLINFKETITSEIWGVFAKVNQLMEFFDDSVLAGFLNSLEVAEMSSCSTDVVPQINGTPLRAIRSLLSEFRDSMRLVIEPLKELEELLKPRQPDPEPEPKPEPSPIEEAYQDILDRINGEKNSEEVTYDPKPVLSIEEHMDRLALTIDNRSADVQPRLTDLKKLYERA